MGNTKVAGGFGYNGFVDNPALLSRVKLVRFSIFNLPLTINKDLWDTAKFIEDNQDNFEEYDDLSEEEKLEFLEDLEEFDGKWTRARFAPMFDVAASFLGYGVGLAVFLLSQHIYCHRLLYMGRLNYSVSNRYGLYVGDPNIGMVDTQHI